MFSIRITTSRSMPNVVRILATSLHLYRVLVCRGFTRPSWKGLWFTWAVSTDTVRHGIFTVSARVQISF